MSQNDRKIESRERENKDKEKKEKVVFPSDEGLHMAAEPQDAVLNSQARDSGGEGDLR